MGGIQLRDCQIEAVNAMHNGCILCGKVGSGKSRTALAYYYVRNGGKLGTKDYVQMTHPKDLYIITTARKRDTCEWEQELGPFLLTTHDDIKKYDHKVVIDSWNNIKKYADCKDAFFIFDEQRVVGYGTWVKAFLKIAKSNEWILLSATPGDKWEDYIPVFIANGFYKNKTQFEIEHVRKRWTGHYYEIDGYFNTGRLIRLRNRLLVDIKFKRQTVSHHETIEVPYNMKLYKDICKTRWNPYTNAPIENASEFCQVLRKICNTDQAREIWLLEILEKHPKAIVFYNFDYELDILKNMAYNNSIPYAEWNGHKHQEIPEGDQWIYLVQYNAGAEGWNCITTDTIVFYSQSYSYKTMIQAAGRIDRMNTPFLDLYFYHLRSGSGIDLAIEKALKAKKKFNERSFYGK